jgi:hypothetical protein
MERTITLPVCGLEVELAVLNWKESGGHFQAAQESAEAGKTDAFVESFIMKHYPKKVLDAVQNARIDFMALYNDTVRLNFAGPEAIKNLSRSGIGAPPQTASTTAGSAEAPTTTE